MAVLVGPEFVDFGGVDEPKTMAMVVSTTEIMDSGNPPIYSGRVLMFPDLSQLASLGGGYAL